MLSGELKGYRELIVWKRAMDLVVEAYELVKRLPKQEQYSLSDQIRRSAISIPSNIAEGNGRNSDKDYIRFLSMARGSQYELETQLMLCTRLGYLSDDDIDKSLNLCDETGRMLNALIARLEKKLQQK
jgi:four helix bundle protein